MPEHSPSQESMWLEQNYRELREYAGEWVAIVGSELVDHDADPVDLAHRVNDEFGPGRALFASVVTDLIA